LDDKVPSSPGTDRAMWAALGGGIASALIALVLIAIMYSYEVPVNSAGDIATDAYPLRGEALKLLLQFFLISSTGGLLLFVLASIRDRRADKDKEDREKALADVQLEKEKVKKRESKIGELQKIDSELNRIYRLLKTAKRRLRYQALECGRDEDGKLKGPFVFAKSDFEQTMGELLAAQINIECLRDDLRSRIDLIEPHRLELIRRRLRYAARFYHDVLEDFERGRVVREPGQYIAGANCENIFNFLSSQISPKMPADIRDCLMLYSNCIDNGQATITDQHGLMDKIEALRKRKDLAYGYRLRSIADDCFALASAEIRERIWILQNGSSASADHAVTHRSVMVDGTPLGE
jgi:hypothetical protein